MPRITISIPVDLKERLANPRVRKSINLSRVCQKALAREVHRVLDLPIDLERMESLLTRMREERETSQDQWFIKGIQAARVWIEHDAPYARLRHLGHQTAANRKRQLAQDPPPYLLKLLQEYRESSGFIEPSFVAGFAHMTGLLWEIVEKNL
jgi:hypothetical protein